MSDIMFLEEFYKNNCNKENFLGIEINSQKGNKWYISIDLFDTPYENKQFDSINKSISDTNWIKCSKDNHIFKASAGIENLKEVIDIFVNWAEN